MLISIHRISQHSNAKWQIWCRINYGFSRYHEVCFRNYHWNIFIVMVLSKDIASSIVKSSLSFFKSFTISNNWHSHSVQLPLFNVWCKFPWVLKASTSRRQMSWIINKSLSRWSCGCHTVSETYTLPTLLFTFEWWQID